MGAGRPALTLGSHVASWDVQWWLYSMAVITAVNEWGELAD